MTRNFSRCFKILLATRIYKKNDLKLLFIHKNDSKISTRTPRFKTKTPSNKTLAKMQTSPESSTSLCVCALAVFVRQRVACEELDMSFRGIRHLKREEVKATQLGIKHQPTSAWSSAKLMKTSARSSGRTTKIYLISLGFIAGVGAPCETHLFSALKVNVTQQPTLYWN